MQQYYDATLWRIGYVDTVNLRSQMPTTKRRQPASGLRGAPSLMVFTMVRGIPTPSAAREKRVFNENGPRSHIDMSLRDARAGLWIHLLHIGKLHLKVSANRDEHLERGDLSAEAASITPWYSKAAAAVHFLAGIFLPIFSTSPCQKEDVFLPAVGRWRPPCEIGSQQGQADFASQAQQVKNPIPLLGEVANELEAVKATQDRAVEAAFTEKTAVVAGDVS